MTTKWQTFLVLLLALFVQKGQAETFILKSGESIEGRLDHYAGKEFVVTLSGGKSRRIPQKDLSSIEFAPVKTPAPEPGPPKEDNFLSTLSKSESKFQTPLDTFQAWRQAAIEGNIDKMVECYASYVQKNARKQLKNLSKEAREKMRDATARTQFVPAKPLYQGDRAMLEVNWTMGMSGDSQVLQFALEGSQWKIVQ